MSNIAISIIYVIIGREIPARQAVSVTKPEPFHFSVTEEELRRRKKEKVQQLLLEEKAAGCPPSVPGKSFAQGRSRGQSAS